MTDPRNPESKFRSNVLDAITRIGDNVSGRLNTNEAATTANTEAIARLTAVTESQGQRIDNLTAATERLESSVAQLVMGIENQRKTMADMIAHQSEFLKTTNKALDIIDRITAARAA